VSAGEEGIAVGSASALTPEDVIFAQYRETGVFQQRGFTLEDFMSQLFANRKDAGKGRNMPVHYGSRELNIVGLVNISIRYLRLLQPKSLKQLVPPTLSRSKLYKTPTFLLELWHVTSGKGPPVKAISTLLLISRLLDHVPLSSSAATTGTPFPHRP